MDQTTKEIIIPEIKEVYDKETVIKSIDKFKKYMTKRNVMIGSSLLMMFIISLVVVFANSEENEILETMTLKKVTNKFEFTGTGFIKTDVSSVSTIDKTDMITLSTEDVLVSVDDKVLIDDKLFSYKEEILEEEPSVFYKKNSVSGVLKGLNDERAIVLTKAVAIGGIPKNTFVPSDGACIVYETTIQSGEKLTGSGIVSVVSENGDDNNVKIDMSSPNYQLLDDGNITVYFVSEVDLGSNTCSNISFLGTKVVINTIEYEPEYRMLTGSITLNTTEVSSALTTVPKETDNYHFIKKKSLGELGDVVTVETNLYEHVYNKGNIETKYKLSEVDGLIKEIKTTSESITVTILNTNENHLEFEIPDEYIDNIVDGMTVQLEIEGLKITSEVFDIHEKTAVVKNRNCKNYDLETTGLVSVTGTDEPVLLVSKAYVSENKVKQVIDGKIIEKIIETEEYNDNYWLIISGILEDDEIEIYN